MPAIHGIFGGFVRIVYTQFPEDILPVAVPYGSYEVSFVFLWLFWAIS